MVVEASRTSLLVSLTMIGFIFFSHYHVTREKTIGEHRSVCQLFSIMCNHHKAYISVFFIRVYLCCFKSTSGFNKLILV